ncbi:baseplate J/gp47 family protein [Desulfobulbus elongatus]|uniref:baseplate J/gp47 family protein n=1 Tax=Desulfobulbus elongatus TaxID=53332 RepID=UPI00048304DA|nr:baseplate J/gp47 family protein [Desulfobulbus elongatus]
MAYEKGFDEILNDILTDFQNTFPGVDVSQGSLARMKATGYASALWGLYKYMEWIGRQAFPDTADTAALEHHGWVRGVPRTAGETDAAYLARLLNYLRRPPAGGNANDYEVWAKEIDGVAQAYAIPLAQGGESVDVIVIADTTTGSEIPGQNLLDDVAAHIAEVRPVGARFVRVLAPEIIEQDVIMTGVGVGLADIVAGEISAYLSSFIPGAVLYLPQLDAIAVGKGVPNPVLTLPAAAVTPSSNEMIRPGVIDVS